VLVGELTWREQRTLADRWTLLIVERAGYGRSSHVAPGENAEADPPLVAELLEGGAHLVGQSSGAVAAMLAAAHRPEAVLSQVSTARVAPLSPTGSHAHLLGSLPGMGPLPPL
jgi:pimeloyl-ACP methyl ester carboxylesterase